MKKRVLFSFFLFFPFINSFAMFQQVEGIAATRVKKVVISPFDEKVIFVCAENGVFKSNDNGEAFINVFVLKDEEIQDIFFDSYFAAGPYVVTNRHLYSLEEGVVTKLFSYSSDEDEAGILSAAKFKGRIYIGTQQGVYFSSEDSINRRQIRGFREETAVYSIAAGRDDLYFAAGSGVYLLSGQDNVKKLFAIRDTDEAPLYPTTIKIDIFNQDKIWLGTNKGLFVSLDKGHSWKELNIFGIDNQYINFIAQTEFEPGNLYLCTNKGLFKADLNKEVSRHIFEGVSGLEVLSMEFNSQGRIYIATPKGLFQDDYFTPFSRAPAQTPAGSKVFAREPSIQEIQQAALRYNEVHPEKIRRWHNALKYRALFPTVILNYDKMVDYDGGSDKYYIGPYDWGVSVAWNVGDLIWNTYEDEVDVRNKLNVPLRLDILDDINRIYFERMKLQKELSRSSLSEQDLENKEIRMKELSAAIDGYTGGFFSRRIKELN